MTDLGMTDASQCAGEPLYSVMEEYCMLCRRSVRRKRHLSADGELVPPPETLLFLVDVQIDPELSSPPEVQALFMSRVQYFSLRHNDADFTFRRGHGPGMVRRRIRLQKRRAVGHPLTRPMLGLHPSCYREAQEYFSPRHLSLHDLYRLGCCLRELLPPQRRSSFYSPKPPISLSVLLNSPASGHPELHAIFSRFNALPLELQWPIQGYVESDHAALVMLALRLLPSLSHHVFDQDSPVAHRVAVPIPQVPDPDKPQWLTATFITICEVTYLHRIAVSSDTGPRESSLCRPLKASRQIEYSMTTHGVTAVRLVHDDGSPSHWLGEHSAEGFRGFCSTADLTVLQDGLRIHRIGPAPAGVETLWRGVEVPRREHGDSLSVGPGTRTYGTNPWENGLPPSGDVWQLCRYVPFERDGVYATGITVYIGSGGMEGMRSHVGGPEADALVAFTPESSWGDVIPLYFGLAPTERITFVGAMHWSRDYMYLVIHTSRGRTCHFGYQRAFWDDPGRVSEPLIPASRRFENSAGVVVRGLTLGPQFTARQSWFWCYHEPLDIRLHLGPKPPDVPAERPQDRLDHKIRRPWTPGVETGEATAHIVTIGSLAGVCRLRAQRSFPVKYRTSQRGQRTKHRMGVCIHRHDGTAEAMGRWDGACPDEKFETTTIWDAAVDEPLDAVIFHLEKETNAWPGIDENGPEWVAFFEHPNFVFVADITVKLVGEASAKTGDTNMTKVWSVDDPVPWTWCFTEDYDRIGSTKEEAGRRQLEMPLMPFGPPKQECDIEARPEDFHRIGASRA